MDFPASRARRSLSNLRLAIVSAGRLAATPTNSASNSARVAVCMLRPSARPRSARTDFVVHDPDHHIVLATNKNDSPPFISFVDPESRKVIAKLEIKAKSLDGMVYDRVQQRYLISVGATAENQQGEIDAIDPARQVVIARYPTPECFPAGLALGP
jgi:hypothetical protein